MHIIAVPLPLSCTINNTDIAIIYNDDADFEKNNRFRVKIGLSSLTQSGQQYNWMRVSLGVVFGTNY